MQQPENARRQVTVFVSYAHGDSADAERLLTELQIQLGPSARHGYQLWRDATHILPGADWEVEIRKALQRCDFGLLLLSPQFLGSEFIRQVELPRYVGGERPCIPVLLQPFDLRLHATHGLERLQFFGLASGRIGRKKAFGDCDRRARRHYCEELFRAIEARIAAEGMEDAA